VKRPKFITECYLIGMIDTCENELKKNQDLMNGAIKVDPNSDTSYFERQIVFAKREMQKYKRELAELLTSTGDG
jgi:hypothetical protein